MAIPSRTELISSIQRYVEDRWTVFYAFLFGPALTPGRKNRAPHDEKGLVAAALLLCCTHERWIDLPADFPNPKTTHHHFQRWKQSGQWDKVLTSLRLDLSRQFGIDLAHIYRANRIHRCLSLLDASSLILAHHTDEARRNLSLCWMVLVFSRPYGPTERKHRGA